jgi:uroporphyrinogen III methyltransferase/synthase
VTPIASLRILSRGSRLARLQVEEALPLLAQAFPETEFKVDALKTIGDRDLATPLTDASVPSDFFSRELDEAQIRGEVDLVIHSAKDLPEPLPDGLVLAAMLPSRDTRDALVIREGADLARGGVIGTSSPVREKAILDLYPQATCKSIRGDIGRRLAQLDEGGYDAVIIAGCALQRLGLEERITEWLDYETTPLQGRLAITVRSDRSDLISALRGIDVRATVGLVAMVGCPADARLLGGLALALLEEADLVLHDRLVPREILEGLGDKAEYVGKKGHAHSTTQAHIHRRILHEAEAGKLVVRLHGGEPGVLGHLGETLDFCQHWTLRSEVIPAVSAAQLTAARARCSLTHRHEGRSIRFLSGHQGLSDHDLPSLAPTNGHLAIYMGVRDIQEIQQRLLQAGWSPQAAVTAGKHLGTADEELIHSTLQHICGQAALESPAVLLVGPRTHPQSYTLFTGTDPRKFVREGPLLHFPMIELKPVSLQERVDLLRRSLADWDGLIFPSSRAVSFLMEALWKLGDTRLLADKKLLAVGPMTAAALRKIGLKADAVPKGFGGAAALAAMEGEWQGRYGYLTSDQSPVEERQQTVRSAGIELDPAIFYQNKPIQHSRLPALPFHRVLFSSGSTVTAYFDQFPDEIRSRREWIAVGSSTLRILHQQGVDGRILS